MTTIVQPLLLLLLCLLLDIGYAAQVDVYPSNTNWKATLNNLKPGDSVIFHAGTYVIGGSYFAVNWIGSQNNPVVIKGVDGDVVTFSQTPGASQQNVINIDGSNFLLKNIQFTGGSRGVRVGNGGRVFNAVFDTLVIHDTTGTAFNANQEPFDYANITLRNSEIYNTGVSTGECVYAGCVDDKCRIHDSLFENNYCHDTLSATGGSQGSGFQVKTGSYKNIIRNNVCKNTRGVCVLLYDDYDRGVNIIESNVVFNTGADHGIQATAGAIIRNNIAMNANQAGIAIILNSVQTGKVVRNIKIIHNTVYIGGDACLRLNSVAANNNITIANNAFFCSGGRAIYSASNLAGITFSKNGVIGSTDGVPAAGVFAVQAAATEVSSPSTFNFYPKSTSTLLLKGNAAYSITYDFNYKSRSATAPTVGAYEYSTATNPGWAVTAAKNPTTPY